MTLLRRSLRHVLVGVTILAVAVVLAELSLDVAALFARDRTGAWKLGAAHKILCVGDSHTFGALVPAEESYPGQLQRFLDERAPAAYSVVNLGIPGMNTAQVRDRLHAALLREPPSIVIVWCGVNDAWNRTESRAQADSLGNVLMRSRLYRLVQTWRNDRRLDNALGKAVPGAGERYDVRVLTDPQQPDHRRLAVVGGDQTEEVAFEDTGFQVDPGMEDRAAGDYRRMVEDCKAAGVSLVFITYPVDVDAFHVANRAIRRVAGEYAIPVIESSRSVQRVPENARRFLWAGHPNGPMYGEIARDIAHLLVGGVLAEITFDDERLADTSMTGPCSRSTTDCARGTGCYRWNPQAAVCNIRTAVLATGHGVEASLRFRVDTVPSTNGGRDVIGLTEDRYGTGIYARFTGADQLELLAIGSNSVERRCGPLASHVAAGTWYGLRVRADKSDRARASLELLTAADTVIDSVTCGDLPAGGGAFGSITIGSSWAGGSSADITFDDVTVREAPRDALVSGQKTGTTP